jgi:hypothetical protein
LKIERDVLSELMGAIIEGSSECVFKKERGFVGLEILDHRFLHCFYGNLWINEYY